MKLHARVKIDIQEALKARDKARLSAARNLLAAFTNELVAKGRRPDGELPDAEAETVVKRLAKQRRESIGLFEEGGRPELAEKEKQELAYLETYLPQEMSEEEIRAVVEKKKEELGVTDKSTDKSAVGQLMGRVMGELKGKADGALVKKIVEETLS